jgi:hypothetical protein
MEDVLNLVCEHGSWRELRGLVRIYPSSLKAFISRRVSHLWRRKVRLETGFEVGQFVWVSVGRRGCRYVGTVISVCSDLIIVRRKNSPNSHFDYVYPDGCVPCAATIRKIECFEP